MIHPLLDALIQPSRPLPAHFRAAGVGMPKPLPRLLQFGSVAPPQSGGSQFTGGRVSQPQTSLAHPQAAQGFTPPHYNAGNPTAPSLAPFVSTPQGGPPTGPPFNVGGAPTGAAPPQPPATPVSGGHSGPGLPFGGLPQQPPQQSPQQSPLGAIGNSTNPPLGYGGYTNTPQIIGGLLNLAQPQTLLGSLLAQLAQQGDTYNPSVPGAFV